MAEPFRVGPLSVDEATGNITSTGNVTTTGTITSSAGELASSLDTLSDTTITAAVKGDTLVYNGTAWIDVTVGANDEVLTADSAQASGVKWAASGGGGGGSKTLVQAFDIGGTPVASIDFLSLDNSFQFYELEIFEWSGDSTSSSFRFFASADNFVSGGVTVQSSMVDGKSDGTTVGRLSAPFGSGIFPIPAAISGDSPNNVNNPVGAALTDFSGITCKFLLRGIGQSKLFSFSCRGQLFNSSRLHDFAAAGVYPDSSGTPYSVNAVRISMSGGNMIRGSGVLWGINNV